MKKHRKRTWDREDDLYIHLQDNINVNNNNINFFKNLLDKFVVNNPKADSELLQFTDGSSNIIKSQLLHLKDQNRDKNNNNTAEENNNTENEDEQQQNGFLLQHMKPHGKSHVLEIPEDDVFVRYEDESSCENHKGKLSVKKSKGKKYPSVKGKKLKDKKSGKGKKRGRKKKIDVNVDVNEEGVDSAVKAACIEEVRVKKENLDYAYDVDAADDGDGDFEIMPVETPVVCNLKFMSLLFFLIFNNFSFFYVVYVLVQFVLPPIGCIHAVGTYVVVGLKSRSDSSNFKLKIIVKKN
jgi:hypothetical protein